MYVYFVEMYIYCVYSTYILQEVHVQLWYSHALYRVSCQSSNLQEMHCFKWEFWIQFARLFQERSPGVKRHPPL